MDTLMSYIPHHSSLPKAHVLLLRTPSGNGSDRYETALKEQHYNPVCIPVVETTYTNLHKLKEIITEGPTKRGYAGVIITSARACEAWKSVTLELVEGDPEIEEDDSADWAKVPFYVVGDATARVLADIRETVGSYPYAPRDIRGAADSGTSEKLARFILRDLRDAAGKTLLYLTGDKNRDTLPSVLDGGGVRLDSLQVYATRGSGSFAGDLRRVFESVPSESPGRWWVVYFAPSEAEFTTPMLREHFALASAAVDEKVSSPTSTGKRPARIATIGPTSGAHLREKLGLRVDVVSPRPKPEALVAAIHDYDATHQ